MAREIAKKGRKRYDGRFSGRRRRWLETAQHDFVVYAGPVRRPDDEDPEPFFEHDLPGDPIELVIEPKAARSRRLILNLDAMTEADLDMIREFLNSAIDDAIVIARARDLAVKQLWEEHGDDSHARLYRRPPRMVERPGDKPGDSQGVQV